MGTYGEGPLAVQDEEETPPPAEVVNFIRRVIRGEKFYAGSERRLHLRYPITIPVLVTPLDDRHQPVAEPFLAITRDISIVGLCMYHTKTVKEKLLRLEMTGLNQEHVSVLLKVARCRPAGPFYEIAGRFLAES
jgi:PilZ domain